MDIRDRSMLLIGFTAGWRGGEIVALNLADVEFRDQGVVLHLRSSKTGQERVAELQNGSCEATCPVTVLREWIRVRGDWEGPLFVKLRRWRTIPKTASVGTTQHRITWETLRDRLRAALEKIGVDPTGFGADSLRAGMSCSCCCRAPVRLGETKAAVRNSRVCTACGSPCDGIVL
jgi:integrase